MGWTPWGGCRSALAGLLVLGACAPTLWVARPTPAVVDLGPRARVLSLVRVDGPADSPEVVVHTLKGRAARQGYFQIEAWQPGEPTDASGRRAYVSLDVAEWSFTSPQTKGGGTEPQARVRLLTRVSRTPEGPWSEPYETGGLIEGSESASDVSHAGASQLFVEASLRAVDDLLRALAPRPRVEDVELDVDSPLLQVSPARGGAYPASRARRGVVRPRAGARGARALGGGGAAVHRRRLEEAGRPAVSRRAGQCAVAAEEHRERLSALKQPAISQGSSQAFTRLSPSSPPPRIGESVPTPRHPRKGVQPRA